MHLETIKSLHVCTYEECFYGTSISGELPAIYNLVDVAGKKKKN